MGILLPIIALAMGTGLGFFFHDPLILLAVTSLLFFVYITIKRLIDDNPQTGNSIENSNLPFSIFRTEFDEFEFMDDRKKSSLKKTLFTFSSYMAGILIGDDILQILLDFL